MSSEWPLVAGLVLLLDQSSKAFVLRRLHQRLGFPAWPALRVRVVSNPKIALGIIGDRRTLVLLFAGTACAIVLLTPFLACLQKPLAQIGLGAALGGGAGNLLDVWRRGAVVDFIDLRVWPIFNFADVAIVAGAALAFWRLVSG